MLLANAKYSFVLFYFDFCHGYRHRLPYLTPFVVLALAESHKVSRRHQLFGSLSKTVLR